MHPYRKNAASDAPDGREEGRPREAWVHWMFVSIGLVPVTWALAHRDAWGPEPSVGLLLVLLAGRSLVVHYGRAIWRAFGD